ncbi:hypothetical protein LTR85_007960 [Meristemomyces frigidus]|nr:hypothetical protein LTR85_007960 [Meristemomyces frigidus]
MTGFSELFDDPKYSDVSIKFGDQVVKAHKAVICKRLEYFEKLCGRTSKFKEADQHTIELFDDDPDAVRAMLSFLYDKEWASRDQWYSGALTFNAKVYLLASKYGCEGLQHAVEEQFSYIILSRFVKSLGYADDLEAVKLFQCPGCDKVSSDEAAVCGGEAPECRQATALTTYFRIKGRRSETSNLQVMEKSETERNLLR